MHIVDIVVAIISACPVHFCCKTNVCTLLAQTQNVCCKIHALPTFCAKDMHANIWYKMHTLHTFGTKGQYAHFSDKLFELCTFGAKCLPCILLVQNICKIEGVHNFLAKGVPKLIGAH